MRRMVSLLLMLVLLAGCAPTNAPETPEVPEEPAPLLSMPVPETPREADMLNLYAAAAQVYDWFDLGTLPLDRTDSRTEGDAVYYRVDCRDFPMPTLAVQKATDSYLPYRAAVSIASLADLRAQAETYFSPALVDALFALSPDHYRDFDGVLYAQDGARGENLYLLDKTVEVNQAEEDRWIVTLTFWADSWEWERPDVTIGYSQTTLAYEKTEDGWRFTSFCPSDGLDLDADTVFTFSYDPDTFSKEAQARKDWSHLQLALFLLHSDGAYTEGASDDLFFRFLDAPQAVLSALATLRPAWQQTVADLLGGAAWYWHPDSGYGDLLQVLMPANDAEQAAAEALRAAYDDAVARGDGGPGPLAAEFALIVPGTKGVLTLGPQEGTFPWGYDLEGTVTHTGSGDTFGTVYELDCGALQLAYSVQDGVEYLYKLSTTVPYDQSEGYLCTARGLYCGYSEESLRRTYIQAVKIEGAPPDPYDACYLYEPGGDAGCKHIAILVKDGVVTKIEMEDLRDVRLLDP